MNTQTPSGWFNQFDPDILAAEGVRGSNQWCIRHWAPAIVFTANGLQAALMMHDEAAITGLSEQNGPLCCQLGDETMYNIWGQCPPPGQN